MGDGWETARKPGRPPVLELGTDDLVKVSASGYGTVSVRFLCVTVYSADTVRLLPGIW